MTSPALSVAFGFHTTSICQAFLLGMYALSIQLRSVHTRAVGDTLTEYRPKRGCHLTGYSQDVHYEGCDEGRIYVNACRGHCPSYTVPWEPSYASKNLHNDLISRATCCRMTSWDEMPLILRCGTGTRRILFRSATMCECEECSGSAADETNTRIVV